MSVKVNINRDRKELAKNMFEFIWHADEIDEQTKENLLKTIGATRQVFNKNGTNAKRTLHNVGASNLKIYIEQMREIIKGTDFPTQGLKNQAFNFQMESLKIKNKTRKKKMAQPIDDEQKDIEPPRGNPSTTKYNQSQDDNQPDEISTAIITNDDGFPLGGSMSLVGLGDRMIDIDDGHFDADTGENTDKNANEEKHNSTSLLELSPIGGLIEEAKHAGRKKIDELKQDFTDKGFEFVDEGIGQLGDMVITKAGEVVDETGLGEIFASLGFGLGELPGGIEEAKATLRETVRSQRRGLQEVKQELDVNNDGEITPEELSQLQFNSLLMNSLTSISGLLAENASKGKLRPRKIKKEKPNRVTSKRFMDDTSLISQSVAGHNSDMNQFNTTFD